MVKLDLWRPFSDLPAFPAILELQQRPQWVAWRYEQRPNSPKPTKPPISPVTGFRASHSKPSDWTSYVKAADVARRRRLEGVGFVLSADDNYTGLDLDGCIDEAGNFSDLAEKILAFAETYAEISPSGNGIRLIARGKVERSVKSSQAGVEIYRDSRYLTITGHHIEGAPDEIRPAPRTIEALLSRVDVVAKSPIPGMSVQQVEPTKYRYGGDFFQNVNHRAMGCLSLWVPVLFGPAARGTNAGGYRISSRDLGRNLEEDLSIAPNGIVDFGVHDMGDARDGKRTPIDLAIEHGEGPDAKAAAFWLCAQLGISPASMGWEEGCEPTAADYAIAANLTVGRGARSAAIVDLPPPIPEEESVGGAVDYFDIHDSLLHPGGVVEEIADWICEWASEPIRIHAIGAALTIVGTLLGRKVYSLTRPTSTVLYIAAVTPSGIGKQHPIDCIKLALKEAIGQSATAAYKGWSNSDASLLKDMQERASVLMIADEFADKLSAMRSRNAATHMAAISEVIRSLWSTNQSSYSPNMTLAARDRGVDEIMRPSLSIYGATTDKAFARSLVGQDVTNGTFNRFLLLPRYGAVASTPERDDELTIPPALKEKLQWLEFCCPDPNGLYSASWVRADSHPPSPFLVPFSERARAMNDECRDLGKRMNIASGDDEALALYARYAEQIKRVALIVACGRSADDLNRAVIEERDMAFARDLVSYSIQQFVLMVRREMTVNASQENRKLVLDIIRRAGPEGLTRRELTRKIKGRLVGYAYDDAISELVESGEIIGKTARGKRGPGTDTYRVNTVASASQVN